MSSTEQPENSVTDSEEYRAAVHALVTDIQSQIRHVDAVRKAVMAGYRADPQQARNLAVLIYQCLRCRSGTHRDGRRLIVWQSPSGYLYYQPPYRIEPSRNLLESSEEGREKNSTNRRNLWPAQAGVLDHLAEDEGGLVLRCEHVVTPRIPATELMVLAKGVTPGRPRRVAM